MAGEIDEVAVEEGSGEADAGDMEDTPCGAAKVTDDDAVGTVGSRFDPPEPERGGLVRVLPRESVAGANGGRVVVVVAAVAVAAVVATEVEEKESGVTVACAVLC